MLQGLGDFTTEAIQESERSQIEKKKKKKMGIDHQKYPEASFEDAATQKIYPKVKP